MKDVLNLLLSLIPMVLNPVAKVAAKGMLKLVAMTEFKEDDQFLVELAKEILAAKESADEADGS